jgi:hypothetical protein
MTRGTGMQSRGDVDAEAWVIKTDEGRSLFDQVAPVRSPGPADLARWRKLATAEQVAAAVRMVELRRRASLKFSRADQMWLERTGLEQATGEVVANYKARRFASQTVVDLCSGLGGDAIALAAASNVIAVDLDHGMGRRLSENARVYEVADRLIAVRGTAERFALPDGAWVHIDPDRRLKSIGRGVRLNAYTPGLEFLRSLIRFTPAGAIKLGPASDFEDAFFDPTLEVELISHRGECKEATIWYGALVTCRRRATHLPEGVSWTDRDGSRGAHVAVASVGGWVFDPDPALLRAGLLDGFAEVHGLKRIAFGVDFLTGPKRVNSPFLSSFEVISTSPLDFKILKREMASRGIGTLEIKVRGLDHTPEQLRGTLKLQGGQPATLLLAGQRGSGMAVLARRWPRLS